jgi:hypothetical protein
MVEVEEDGNAGVGLTTSMTHGSAARGRLRRSGPRPLRRRSTPGEAGRPAVEQVHGALPRRRDWSTCPSTIPSATAVSEVKRRSVMKASVGWARITAALVQDRPRTVQPGTGRPHVRSKHCDDLLFLNRLVSRLCALRPAHAHERGAPFWVTCGSRRTIAISASRLPRSLTDGVPVGRELAAAT